MHACAEAVELIKQEEALRLTAYRCPAGECTIGYGHTGPDVHDGMVISVTRADELLGRDLARFDRGVEALLAGHPVTQEQFGALVSFAFNAGLDNLRKSTLLRKFLAGDVAGAADEFPKWNKARHPVTHELRVLPGLVRRRARERALFLEQPPPQVEVAFATPSPELRDFTAIVPPEHDA